MAAAAGAVAASLLGDQMLYVVMSARPDAWGLSAAAVGVLLSVNRFVRLASNPLVAVAVNQDSANGSFPTDRITIKGLNKKQRPEMEPLSLYRRCSGPAIDHYSRRLMSLATAVQIS